MSCTIQDIANELNLSTATVSRSLKQNARIAATTRAKVAEAAARMGYQGRSRRISTQSTSQQFKLAVLLSSANHKQSPNTLRELQGIQSQADDMGMHVEVDYAVDFRHQPYTQKDIEHRQQILEHLERERHQAALLLGRHDPTFVAALRQQFTPIISLSWQYANVEHDLVSSNNMTDFALSTQKLIDLGHCRLTYVDECYKASFHDQRHAGFLQSCVANRLDMTQQAFYSATGYDDHGLLIDDAVDTMLANGSTAYACANDRVAYLLLDALGKRGISVPDQVSVIGYDGMQPSDQSSLRLTTMSQDFMEHGRACVSLAHRRITQPSSSNWSVCINGHWTAGQTIAPPCR
jgi:LacI family transcriptional regulator